ncbi:hypothetical protein BGZ52_010644 [Haplosporangium bisporale]|nr:hypothetical protein BGZ52_010644 [Haplosporangium bisporale]
MSMIGGIDLNGEQNDLSRTYQIRRGTIVKTKPLALRRLPINFMIKNQKRVLDEEDQDPRVAEANIHIRLLPQSKRQPSVDAPIIAGITDVHIYEPLPHLFTTCRSSTGDANVEPIVMPL